MTLEAFLPESSNRLRNLFARLDPDFAAVWETHVSRLLTRDQLDLETRFLVMTAQYTVTERHHPLRETIGAAVDAGVDVRDLLEVVLQLYVYTGPWVVAGAAEVFESVLGARGIDLPEPAGRPSRDFDAEQQTWSEQDRSDARIEGFLERYGWHAIANGLRLRPGHHINMLDTLDTLDPHFLEAWLDGVYEGMYGRGRLEDRTRLLCVVGATLALGETHQSRRHMRAAMRSGATPRELLEVVFHTTAFFGHPYVMPAAFDDLVRIAYDEGKVTDLVPADRVEDTMRIINARVTRRHDIVDGIG